MQRLQSDEHDIYIADFTHLGVYACRILVPGLSEIYPIDDLEFENNSVANPIREAILNLSDPSGLVSHRCCFRGWMLPRTELFPARRAPAHLVFS